MVSPLARARWRSRVALAARATCAASSRVPALPQAPFKLHNAQRILRCLPAQWQAGAPAPACTLPVGSAITRAARERDLCPFPSARVPSMGSARYNWSMLVPISCITPMCSKAPATGKQLLDLGDAVRRQPPSRRRRLCRCRCARRSQRSRDDPLDENASGGDGLPPAIEGQPPARVGGTLMK